MSDFPPEIRFSIGNSSKTDEKSGNSGQNYGKNDAKLQEISVDAELATVYNAAKDLMESVIDDSDIPANQRAQVLNSVAALVRDMAKTRIDLFNSERVRRMEMVLIRTLRKYPDLAEDFLEAYETALATSES